MPLYDYTCASCGPFSVLRPLTEFNAPGTCPQCCAVSPKALCSPTYHGASKRQGTYDAIASHPPRDSQKTTSHVARHGMSCSCCRPLSVVHKNS
jgi:putative FmdB family regulatory protein